MPLRIPAPTQVLTLVFLAWTAGTVVFGTWSRLWGEIQPGHFKVIWLVSAGLGLAAGFGDRAAWIVAGACVLAFLAVYRDLDRETGFLAAAAAIVALGRGGPPFGAPVAALLGSVTNAMLLGHWHLNQPRLGTKPIMRLVWGVWAGLAVYAGASVALLLRARDVGVLGAATAIGFTLFAGVLTGMVTHLVRTRSIMSATGILYLEILMCLVAAFTGSLAALAR